MKITNYSIIAAMFLFEKVNGNNLDRSSIQLIKKEGFTNVSPSELVNSLLKNLKSTLDDNPLLGTGIFALGKQYDLNLKDLLVEMLHRTLDTNPDALYQT